jgi:uncharacterized protein (DUF2235 family)
MKRIALFLDGTWNRPDDNTNVWRSKLLLSERDAIGNEQRAYYGVGVGTKRFERVRGGAFGEGLDANIRSAYQWLMSVYEEGDKIYLFGFSRGAYTARSLAGLINKCGLLLPGASFSVPQLFERYKQGDDAKPLYKLRPDWIPRNEWTAEDVLLVDESRRVEIEFIGVWDTVGALGIPAGKLAKFVDNKLADRRDGKVATVAKWFGLPSAYYFHSTTPSGLYNQMYQALAIDEQRPQFQPTLWTKFQPANKPDPPTLGADQKLEQRWFVGAHCNVGGGYRSDPLAQIPLAWLQEKATCAGLQFKRKITLKGDEQLTPPVDSYAEFLHGGEYVVTLGHRYYRPIAGDPVPTKSQPGLSHSLNEHIDATVFERWRQIPSYRPKNLVEWAARHRIQPDTISGSWPGPATQPAQPKQR